MLKQADDMTLSLYETQNHLSERCENDFSSFLENFLRTILSRVISVRLNELQARLKLCI